MAHNLSRPHVTEPSQPITYSAYTKSPTPHVRPPLRTLTSQRVHAAFQIDHLVPFSPYSRIIAIILLAGQYLHCILVLCFLAVLSFLVIQNLDGVTTISEPRHRRLPDQSPSRNQLYTQRRKHGSSFWKWRPSRTVSARAMVF